MHARMSKYGTIFTAAQFSVLRPELTGSKEDSPTPPKPWNRYVRSRTKDGATRPWHQFEAQVAEETERLRQTGILDKAADSTARHAVKEDWKLLDIYEDEWDYDTSPVEA
ncbi:hypothetical protein P154DRAFT_41772 [Amniculicola lignicola CBS 123094]|uniref:Uncharacterized protein n=1 Tax=Amniculicola lignicola CBS 123094 TaxID=1392246 RepID=A0A6A5WRP4_9PLEO|nr:hypothetical protein P154DRAFT_41772 [Amniculicola lignicola CBS 123094]